MTVRRFFRGSRTWVDDALIWQILKGEKPDRFPTEAERRLLVRALFYKGYSARESAEKIGISQRSVARWLKREGLKEADRTIHPRANPKKVR